MEGKEEIKGQITPSEKNCNRCITSRLKDVPPIMKTRNCHLVSHKLQDSRATDFRSFVNTATR